VLKETELIKEGAHRGGGHSVKVNCWGSGGAGQMQVANGWCVAREGDTTQEKWSEWIRPLGNKKRGGKASGKPILGRQEKYRSIMGWLGRARTGNGESFPGSPSGRKPSRTTVGAQTMKRGTWKGGVGLVVGECDQKIRPRSGNRENRCCTTS